VKGWITSQTADHFRLPLRMQLAEMILPNSKLLEVGCGTGDLFYLVSRKISYGLGMETSLPLVRYGRSKLRKQDIKNVAIRRARFPETLSYVAKFDVGVASLFFSKLTIQSAVDTLTKMAEVCEEILIAEFDSPQKSNASQAIADSVRGLDKQKKNAFWRKGGVEGLVECCNMKITKKVEGPYQGLFIYTVAPVSGTLTKVGVAKEVDSVLF